MLKPAHAPHSLGLDCEGLSLGRLDNGIVKNSSFGLRPPPLICHQVHHAKTHFVHEMRLKMPSLNTEGEISPGLTFIFSFPNQTPPNSFWAVAYVSTSPLNDIGCVLILSKPYRRRIEALVAFTRRHADLAPALCHLTGLYWHPVQAKKTLT